MKKLVLAAFVVCNILADPTKLSAEKQKYIATVVQPVQENCMVREARDCFSEIAATVRNPVKECCPTLYEKREAFCLTLCCGTICGVSAAGVGGVALCVGGPALKTVGTGLAACGSASLLAPVAGVVGMKLTQEGC